jgi:hypothetical protein
VYDDIIVGSKPLRIPGYPISPDNVFYPTTMNDPDWHMNLTLKQQYQKYPEYLGVECVQLDVHFDYMDGDSEFYSFGMFISFQLI